MEKLITDSTDQSETVTKLLITLKDHDVGGGRAWHLKD